MSYQLVASYVQWNHNIKLVNRQSKPVFVECGRILTELCIVPDAHNPRRTSRSRALLSEKTENAGDKVVSKSY